MLSILVMLTRLKRMAMRSDSGRQSAYKSLTIERLDARLAFAAVAEVDPNNSFGTYQPLNGDSAYAVSGSISSIADVDFFAFYAKEGATINANVRALNPSSPLNQQFDPVIGVFSPSGQLVAVDDDSGTGSGWAGGLSIAATTSGVWRIAISDYPDFSFDGGGGSGDGFGTDTGAYVLDISGALKPEIVVKEPADVTEFFIEGDTPRMPEITVELIGIAPAPSSATEYTWATRVVYTAADYPAVAGQRGVGRDIASPNYDDNKIEDATVFTPTFFVGAASGVANYVIRGGTLNLTANATIAGVQIEAKTPESGDRRLRILGRNPSSDAVSRYVETLAVPTRWPTTTQYDYHSTLRQIIRQESGIRQFDSVGVPLWSRDNARGVGLMQITNPAPTDNEVWDWRRNVDRGAVIFRQKLETAIRRLTNLFNAVQTEATPLGATVPPITGDMIVLNAIRGFNGYNNGNGILDEWRAVRAADGALVITNGQTSWERVPVAERGTTSGDANYVNNVLNRADF